MASTSPDSKRKTKSSFLRRAALNPLTRIHDDRSSTSNRSSTDQPASPTKISRRTGLLSAVYPRASSDAGLSRSSVGKDGSTEGSTDSPPRRPRILQRGSRPSSILGTLSSVKSNQTDDTDTPPLTASSGRAPSFTWSNWGVGGPDLSDIGRNRTVLHFGEVQTNSGLFRKRKEFLVLTETHLVRFKNRSKASETFHSISPFEGRMALPRHSSMPSTSSAPDEHSLASETSGEKIAGIPLEQIIAVYPSEDTRYSPALEVACLDGDSGQASFLTLLFSDAEDKDLWSRSIRSTANKARLADMDPIAPKLSEYAARVVERELDYEVTDYRIYKAVKRAATKSALSRTSSDDSVKSSSSSICFLVLGAQKVHIISLPKNLRTTSISSLPEVPEGGSFGIMTLTALILSSTDNTFSLSFRAPFQKSRVFHLASLASFEISQQLRVKEHFLRPGWLSRPYLYEVPSNFEEDPQLGELSDAGNAEDLFERTLIAYCHAYNVNASAVRYGISHSAEDPPRFDLYEPSYTPPRPYSPLELLAIFRALRFNETFGTISFAGINLDGLNGVYDPYGVEHVCTRSHYGIPVRLKVKEQQNASLLVQEVRALAVCSKNLRRLDFAHSISCLPAKSNIAELIPPQSSGIVEAMYPLCKAQATNVDWLVLNGITLSETDLSYLVGMGAEKACHFRSLEVSQCGLTDRSLTLLLDAFKTHDLTLEVLDISENTLRLVPSIFTRQLSDFSIIRRLDLSNLAVTVSTEALVPLETFLTWRLEQLRLRGIPLNKESIEPLCGYLKHAQSSTLRELDVSSCNLGGDTIALLLHSLISEPGVTRELHLDASENPVVANHSRMTAAIARGFTPTLLSLRGIEYEQEVKYQELLLALASNRSTRSLNLAKTSLPGNANEATSMALERLFSTNAVLEEIDISGEDSRLEITKFGTGLNRALSGLKRNKTLTVLRIQYQKLGLPGASALAEVLKDNSTLRELHCDQNAITLTGFTDLVNSLAGNKSLLYLPTLDEGREAALQQTKQQIKAARTRADGSLMSSSTATRSSSVRSRLSIFGSGSLGPSNSTRSVQRVAEVPQWTEQDVQAALRIVSEGWEAQANRLRKYLQRNWRIYQGVDPDEADPTIYEERGDRETPRPSTGGSVAKALERAMLESTPTLEKEAQFREGILSGHARSGSGDAKTPTKELQQAIPEGSSPQQIGAQHDGSDEAGRSNSRTFSIPRKSLQSDFNRPMLLDNVGIDITPLMEKDDLFAIAGMRLSEDPSTTSTNVPMVTHASTSTHTSTGTQVSGSTQGDEGRSHSMPASSSTRLSSDSATTQSRRWAQGLDAHARDNPHMFSLSPPLKFRKRSPYEEDTDRK